MKEKLFLSLLFGASLSASALAQVYASPYVSANARSYIVLPGTGGITQSTFDTGYLSVTGAAAVANTTASNSITDAFGVNYSARSTTRFSASAGVLKGYVASGVNVSGSIGNSSISISSTSQGWSNANTNPGATFLDTITLSGAPVGTLVPITITLLLEGTSNFSGFNTASGSGSFTNYGELTVTSTADGQSAQVTHDGIAIPNQNVSKTASFTTVATVGTPFQIGGTLYLSTFARRSAVDNGTAFSDFNAENTGLISINAPSGISFTSESGYSYAPVPEPASIAAIGLGVAGLLRRRTKKS